MARILVTRPIDESLQTAAALERMGHVACIDPMLAIVFRGEPLPEGPHDVLVVTSGNALAALRVRPEADSLKALPLLAVGRRTGATARAMGFADVSVTGRDLDGLVAHVAAGWKQPRRVLYLAGADRSGDLLGALERLGHDVSLTIVYEARKATAFRSETQDALRAGQIDAVLHYSARTADAFIACAGGPAGLAGLDVRHLCLSRKVAEVLGKAGAGKVAFAALPEEDALLVLI